MLIIKINTTFMKKQLFSLLLKIMKQNHEIITAIFDFKSKYKTLLIKIHIKKYEIHKSAFNTVCNFYLT